MRERQRRRGESDEQAQAEERRAQAGLEELQHRRSTFRIRVPMMKTAFMGITRDGAFYSVICDHFGGMPHTYS